MPQLKFECAKDGSRIWLDGREVESVRRFSLHAAMDEVVTADLEVYATEQTSFEGRVDLHVRIVAQPGYLVLKEEVDGVTRYRVMPEPLGL